MSRSYSHRVESIHPSPTLAISTKAAALRAAGQDIISLSAGEPDFDTPDHIKAAAITAIEQGRTKYTPVGGTPQLKEAIQYKCQRDHNLSYQSEEIIVSVGAKQALFNLAQALLNPEDEVIIPAPYWVSYPAMTLLTGAKPVILKTTIADRFKITPEQLAAAITSKTKLLFLNSPSNPTGVAYSRAELHALGEVLIKHPDIVIASDDIYEHILWEGTFSNIVMACPDLKKQTVLINGVSKSYAMTGWRIGFACGPRAIIQRMQKIQGQSTSNATSIAQAAAEAALLGDLTCVQQMCQAFQERHNFLVHSLNNISGIKCLPGQGTFYAFADMTNLIANTPSLQNDCDLAEKLISHAGLALVPGSAFGASGYLRFSFATSLKLLEKAVARLEMFVNSLH